MQMATTDITEKELENEIWLPISFNLNYAVSNLGRVKRVTAGRGLCVANRILRPATTFDGYFQVSLSENNRQTSIKVHRLVALMFIGEPPEGLNQVNHIDHDRKNNRVENLEWVDNKTNQMWSRIAGRAVRGEKMFKAKLTDADIPVIRELRKTGMGLQKIADKFGVHNSVIHRITKGDAWTHIPDIGE